MFAVGFCVNLNEILTHFYCSAFIANLCTILARTNSCVLSLFPLTPTSLLLFAGGNNSFWALLVFGLSFLLVLQILEDSLMVLFFSFLFGMCAWQREQARLCPSVSQRAVFCIPSMPTHLSASMEPPSMTKMCVIMNLCPSVPICVFSRFPSV